MFLWKWLVFNLFQYFFILFRMKGGRGCNPSDPSPSGSTHACCLTAVQFCRFNLIYVSNNLFKCSFTDGINNTLNTIKTKVDQTQKAQLEMSSVVSSAVSSLEAIRQNMSLFHKEGMDYFCFLNLIYYC